MDKNVSVVLFVGLVTGVVAMDTSHKAATRGMAAVWLVRRIQSEGLLQVTAVLDAVNTVFSASITHRYWLLGMPNPQRSQSEKRAPKSRPIVASVSLRDCDEIFGER